MIAEGDKEIEKELTATIVHLELHCAALLKCRATADDERQVVSTQFGVRVRRMSIGVACRGEDSAALDATL